MKNLGDIIRRIREITGHYSPTELTNDEIITAVNYYYTVVFPQQVKLDYMETFYEFVTVAHQGNYPQPLGKWINFLPPAFVDNFPLVVTQNISDIAAGFNPPVVREIIDTGNGSSNDFTYTIGGVITPHTLMISNGTEALVDNNLFWTQDPVSLTPTVPGAAGTVNYSTGEISYAFSTPTPFGKPIRLTYAPLITGKPQYLTMMSNTFYLRPHPDKAYKIKIKGYKGLEPLVQATDKPQCEEWSLAIVYGTAKELLVRFSELQGAGEMQTLLREQLSLVVRRTQLNANVRIPYSFL